MSDLRKIDVPQRISELFEKPEIVAAALELLNAISAIQVNFVQAGGGNGASSGLSAIKGTPPNLILPLPLKFSRVIADSTATAASVSTQLNLLLAELRKTGQLPS